MYSIAQAAVMVALIVGIVACVITGHTDAAGLLGLVFVTLLLS